MFCLFFNGNIFSAIPFNFGIQFFIIPTSGNTPCKKFTCIIIDIIWNFEVEEIIWNFEVEEL